MNRDNSDKKTEDDVEYHIYPYSYETDNNDSNLNDKEPAEITAEENTHSDKQENKNTDEPGNAQIGSESFGPEESAETATSENTKESTGPKKETTTSSAPSPEDTVVNVKKKSRKWQYAAIVAVLLLVIAGSFAIVYQTFNGDLYSSNDKVAVIYVQGTLITSSVPGGLGYVSSEEVSDNIRKALRDENVKAIVLRVNSGGGSATAGEEIYTEVRKASDSGIPVIISMGDVAASAAYHLSAPADIIIANPSTMTGSIGTIWTFQNLSEYYDSEGIDYYIVKSGEFKDMGGSWRGLSDDEKEYANKVVAEIYSNFVMDVAEGRDMSVTEVKDLADGRIYTGRKAKELGLIDEFGNLYDSIDRAAEAGGIEGDPTIVYLNKPSISSLLFGSETEAKVDAEEFLRYYEESPYGQIT